MVLEEFGKIMPIREVPEPNLSADDSAIVKVEANGICRSDWHWWMRDWGWIGLEPQLPRILGHEFCGVVEQTGKAVKHFKKGDHVIVPFTNGDGDFNCPSCMSGKNHICDNIKIIGSMCDGGYGRYVNITHADYNLVKLPERFEFFEASVLGCRYMTSYHGVVSRACIKPGESFVVYGAGGIGMSAIQVASAMGAFVVVVDISDKKLEMAKSIGGHAVVNATRTNPVEAVMEITKGGADLSLDALGEPNTCRNGILSLKKGGRHLQIGLTTQKDEGNVSLPIDLMIAKENSLIASIGMPKSEYAAMLRHIDNLGISPAKLITKRVSIEEAPQIISSMADYKTIGMNVVDRW